jgi:polar amino acid transport system substrate-binding protein
MQTASTTSKAGVLRVATFDSNPPFGFVDAKSHHIVGLDVDYAKALADKLGVKLQLQPTNPANRIPFLTSGKVDLVLANFTITDERAKQVDFSIPYFSSGQQFLAKKGVLKSADQLNGLRVGADKGTTNEITLRDKSPARRSSRTTTRRSHSRRCARATCRRSRRTARS